MSLPPVHIAAIPWAATRSSAARTLAETLHASITWDRRHDAYDTFTRNVAAAGNGPALFMEDDVILTDQFATKAAAVIAEHPDHVIQFYSNRRADTAVGSRWEPGRTFMNNQCWYAPPGMPPDLVEWLIAWPDRASYPTGYDVALAQFLQRQGLKYWLQVPSLVQHRTWKSAINARRPTTQRQSRTFVP